MVVQTAGADFGSPAGSALSSAELTSAALRLQQVMLQALCSSAGLSPPDATAHGTPDRLQAAHGGGDRLGGSARTGSGAAGLKEANGARDQMVQVVNHLVSGSVWLAWPLG